MRPEYRRCSYCGGRPVAVVFIARRVGLCRRCASEGQLDPLAEWLTRLEAMYNRTRRSSARGEGESGARTT